MACEIREKFILPSILLPEVVGKSVPVAVHVQVGSGDTSLFSYYREAMGKMKGIFPDAVFLVFCEESEKCSDFIARLGPGIVLLPPMDEFDAMAMMHSCTAFILSGSTICWWSAWLSGSRHVIYPEMQNCTNFDLPGILVKL